MTENLIDAAALEDGEIVAGLQSEDRSAWLALYDKYSANVWACVARLLGSRHQDITEVVQETFLAACQSSHTYNPAQGPLWPWLAGIAHSQVSQYWRRRMRAQRDTSWRSPEGTTPDVTVAAGHVAAEQAEQRDRIREVLSQLPSGYALILADRFLEGLTLAQLQDRHGGTRDAIQSRLQRAKAAFRAIYERSTTSASNTPSSPSTG